MNAVGELCHGPTEWLLEGKIAAGTGLPAPSDQTTKPGTASRRRFLIMLGLGAGGGIVIGGGVGALLARSASNGQQLDVVATGSLDMVGSTLAPQARARLIDEARRCHEPLARVAIWHSPETKGGTITLISGSYYSPPFPLTTTPSLVALPFPTPYATGRGRLIVTGEADNLSLALRPQFFARITAPTAIDVWWTPVGGCP
jgi:hypothetical protein